MSLKMEMHLKKNFKIHIINGGGGMHFQFTDKADFQIKPLLNIMSKFLLMYDLHLH